MSETTRVTKYNISYVDAEGKTQAEEYISEAQYEKAAKDLKEKGINVDVTKVQSFVITEATSLDEAASLFPKRALEFLNYGAKLNQQNVMRDLMRDSDWPGQDGDFDLLPEVQEPKEGRSKMSDKDKAMAKLAKVYGIDRAQLEAVLSQFAVPATN